MHRPTMNTKSPPQSMFSLTLFEHISSNTAKHGWENHLYWENASYDILYSDFCIYIVKHYVRQSDRTTFRDVLILLEFSTLYGVLDHCCDWFHCSLVTILEYVSRHTFRIWSHSIQVLNTLGWMMNQCRSFWLIF